MPASATREWETITTWANAMTLARTAIAVPLGVYALVEASTAWLVAAYAFYWLGDGVNTDDVGLLKAFFASRR